MNWTEFYNAVQKHKGKLYDLSIGSPFLFPKISELIIKSVVKTSREPNIEKELGSYKNHYGLPRLIKIFASRCSRDFRRQIKSDNIVITPGAQAALFYIQEYINKKNQRILYPFGIEFPGAVSHLVNVPAVGTYKQKTVSDGMITPELNFKSFDWKDVGAVIVSRPHNPTGYVLTIQEIKRLVSEANKHGAFLVIDETYGLPFAPISKNYKSIDASNTLHIYSFSKVGLVGERIGIAVGPEEIISDMKSELIKNVIHSSKIGQYLALSVIDFLQNQPSLSVELEDVYRERWEYCRSVMKMASNINTNLKIALRQGGGFLWCEWQGRKSSDEIFLLLLKKNVAVVPGSCFKIDKSETRDSRGIRISLGADENDLKTGIKIVAETFKNI